MLDLALEGHSTRDKACKFNYAFVRPENQQVGSNDAIEKDRLQVPHILIVIGSGSCNPVFSL